MRFVVCHNPEQADRDAAVRTNLITHLEQLIEGSDGWTASRRLEFVGSLKAKPGLRRYLRRTANGLLRIDALRPSARRTWTASGCCSVIATNWARPPTCSSAQTKTGDANALAVPHT